MWLYLTELGDYTDAELARLTPLLPPLRRSAAEGVKVREMRAAKIVGYALLAYAVSIHYPDLVPGELLTSERGKPYLPDPRLTFSLSHTAYGLALAIGDGGCELGVDLEVVRPLRPSLIERFSSREELAEIQAASDRDEAAIRLWTKKEANAKRTGFGIAQDLRLLSSEGAASQSVTLGGARHVLSLSPTDTPTPIRTVTAKDLISFALKRATSAN